MKTELSRMITKILPAALFSMVLVIALLPAIGIAQDAAALESQLLAAAGEGNLPAVRKLLAEGANVSARERLGSTALMKAAEAGHREIAQLLIDRGAEVNAKNMFDRTALMDAVWMGRLDMVRLLLDKGADVNAMGVQRGWVDLALKTQSVDMAKEALASGSRRTVLMEAASEGHLEIATLLIDKGAHVNAMNQYGETALKAAILMCPRGNTNMVKLLLNKRADVNATRGGSPLREAVRGSRIDLMKLLFDKGADPNRDRTALWLAVWGAKVEVLILLLDHGADANAKNAKGRTLLMDAAARDHHIEPWYYKLAPLLPLLIGGPPTGPAYEKHNRDPKVVKLLLEGGADVTAKDKDGWTALKRARKRGSKEIVEILKAHGAKE